MTRRAFFALALPALAQAPDSPKNRVAIGANQFHEQYLRWKDAFNAIAPGSINVRETATFNPLREMWRKVERLHDEWISGRVKW